MQGGRRVDVEAPGADGDVVPLNEDDAVPPPPKDPSEAASSSRVTNDSRGSTPLSAADFSANTNSNGVAGVETEEVEEDVEWWGVEPSVVTAVCDLFCQDDDFFDAQDQSGVEVCVCVCVGGHSYAYI